MCVRIAEASCGAKWMHKHPTSLKAMKEKFPQYAATFEKIGLSESMDSHELVEHIKSKLVCTKKECKAALAAVADGDMAAATAKMGGKACLTL